MKIAFSPTIFRVQREGGISRYFYQLITGSLLRGNQVFLSQNAPDGKYLQLLKEANVDFGSERKSPWSTLMSDERNPFGWTPKSLHKWDPEIIHETFFSAKWFRSGPKKAKRVLTVYDLIQEKLEITTQTRSRKLQALELADHVICISKSTQNDLVEYYNFPMERTSVIYLAPFPLINTRNLPTPIELEKIGRYFLFVGLRDGYKNFRIVLDAFSKLSDTFPDYKILAFGGGHFSEAEVEILKRHNLIHKVIHITGSDDLLAHAYNKAVALIYPSVWEGFGMPPLEALAAGTSVISSNCESLIEVLSDEDVLFFDPLSSLDLAEKMTVAITSELTKGKGKTSESMKQSKYSWENCIDETLKLYRSLL